MKRKRISRTSRNNLLLMLLNAFVSFFILMIVYWDYGFSSPHYFAAVFTVVLYFGLIGSPLSVCRIGDPQISAFFSSILVAASAAFSMGAWVWGVAAVLICVYEFLIARNTWVLAVLDLFFTGIIAAISCGLFALLFWLF